MYKRHFAIAAALVALSNPARAGDIPFTARNDDTSTAWCIACHGPWARSSLLVKIDAGESKEFYKAKEDIFSPFGSWSCTTVETLFGGCDYPIGEDPPPVAEVDFCLENIPSNEVDLVIASDGRSISSNFTQGCDSTTVKSQLGDQAGASAASASGSRGEHRHSRSESSSDEDTFWLTATSGDELQIRLDADGESGSRGEHAALLLLGSRGDVLETAEGPLPLELVVTAPGTGRHQVVVHQGPLKRRSRRHHRHRESADPFTGGYVLSVGTSGEPSPLEPSPDVEK